MIFKRLKAEGLAHNTYFIGSGGEAVVIDPRRDSGDVNDCLSLARENCMEIKYILETHRNEDFTIGSLDLKKASGARIGHSKNTNFRYGDIPLKDRDQMQAGDLIIKTLETPGHTLDSLTYVLFTSKNPDAPLMAFTGDVLFIGSTGRLDLLGKDRIEQNARELHDSLHDKILKLGDQTILCPAHGAGSVCGSGISDIDESTIGYEKRTNLWLSMDLETFVKKKMEEKFVRPPYFSRMEEYNLNGPPGISGRIAIKPLNLEEFSRLSQNSNTVIVDIRAPQAYGGGHIPGSYSIWLKGMALYPGWLFDYDREFLLVAQRDEDAKAADQYMARLGYDKIRGYLCGGFEVWQNSGMPIEHTGELSADELKSRMDKKDISLIDVREPREWKGGIVPEAIPTYVGELEKNLPDLPKDKPVASMCSVGNRGSIGASILQRAGYKNVYNVLGGFMVWKKKGYPVTKPTL